MNYFIIGGDKKEYGPASAEQVRQWIREGRADGNTLLRADGETAWKPLQSYAEFQGDLVAIPSKAPRAIPPPVTDARPNSLEDAPDETPVAANVPVSIGHAFARAWHLAAEHFGTVFGACLLVWMALTAIQFLPLGLGGILAMILYGPLYGGLFLVFLKLIRTGEASPADVFAFSGQNAFMLIVTGIVGTMAAQFALLCCCLPGVYLQIAWLFGIPLVADRGVNFWQGLEGSRRAITPHWFRFLGLFLVSFLPYAVFSSYTHARIAADQWPLVQQAQTEFMNGGFTTEKLQRFADEAQKIQSGYDMWSFVCHLLLLIVMPLGFGSFAFVYEDLFRRKK
jgi:hypothetical protein